MKPIDKICSDYRITVKEKNNNFFSGVIRFTDGTFASIIAGSGEGGIYDHVSVSPFNRRMPTWDQMCEVKDICWWSEEEAYQIHPKSSKYVNKMPNCLHIWARHDGKCLFDGLEVK